MADNEFLKAAHAGNVSYFQKQMETLSFKAALMNYSHNKSGDKLIHIISRLGHSLILSVLNDENFNLEAENFDGKRALHEAAQKSKFNCVEYLLKAGVKVDPLKRADWTPLMLACTKDNLAVISLLLKYGANPRLINKDGWSSFHIAAREGHMPVIEHLLDHDASLWDTVSKNGRTPLHTAVLHGHTALVQYMLGNCGFQTDIPDSCGTTPLMDALRVQNIEIARMLISKHKASILREDNLGRQAIHQAAQAGAIDSIQFLVEECSVNPATPSSGQKVTPLHVAAKEGQMEALLLLLSLGADVNSQDEKGRTALHIAAGAQHFKTVEALLQHGAQLLMDSTGTTPRQLARKLPVIDAFDRHLHIT